MDVNDHKDLTPAVRATLGSVHVVLGMGLAIVAIVALRARYLPVDLAVGTVATLLAASGAALLVRVSPAVLLARIASGVTLTVGLAFLTGLIWSASYLRGIYGDLGRGASSMFLLIAFAILPYLVVYPIVALVLLRPGPAAPKGERPAEGSAAADAGGRSGGAADRG